MIKILFPFSWLYGLITDFRNWLFDKGLMKSTTFDIPIINVGNLTVGGTGKTPHVEYLIKLLKNSKKVATLSRGYGRKTKGFLLADSQANAQTIGDEPYQFYQKFGNEIAVCVGEKRVEAIQKMRALKPDTNVIILDDAFQHRPVKPSLNLLLVDYNRPIYDDFPFPVGRLRERRYGVKRADAVIVSKCPKDLSQQEQQIIQQNLQPYLQANAPVFFTKILYGKPRNCRLEDTDLDGNKILLLSGIANPLLFEAYAKEHFEVVNHLIYPDHHDFSEQDLLAIHQQFKQNIKAVLMTEKDMVKFQPLLGHPLLQNVSLFYLPIEIDFLTAEMKKGFDEMISVACKMFYI
jgi:tetraacyldisaccharide 4'-kinase